MKTWHLENRKIKDLLANPKNPRYIKKEMAQHLNDSIAKFGLIDKPIITQDNLIIGGHQRVNTLKKMKVKEVECWVCDQEVTQEEIDELMIGLNLHKGEFDYDKLANEFDIDKLFEWGFTPEELLDVDVKDILNEVSEEDNEVLEPPKDPITKPGDIYELGNHRLMCGDSTNPDNVKALLNGNEPILMCTDPPYGVNYDPGWRDKAGKGCKAFGKVKNDDKINWSLVWHLFPGSIAYIWHAGKYCSEVEKSLTDCDFEIISQIIWQKQNFALSRGDYHWKHEPCWYAVKKGHQHNWQGARDQHTVWEISSLNAFGKNKDQDEERTNHSTQKPIECMARPIRNNTAEGEGVYDPFVGSGTTIIAAEKLNRICYAMEIDPGYCDICVARWVKLTGKKAKLLNEKM